MPHATIKLYLPHGDAKSLRSAEIMNWTGKAIAAPRTELDDLVQLDDLGRTGFTFYWGRSQNRVSRAPILARLK